MSDPTGKVFVYLSTSDDNDIPIIQSDNKDTYLYHQEMKEHYLNSKVSNVKESVYQQNFVQSIAKSRNSNTFCREYDNAINSNAAIKFGKCSKNLTIYNFSVNQEITSTIHGSTITQNSISNNSKDHNYSDTSGTDQVEILSNFMKNGNPILCRNGSTIINKNMSSLALKGNRPVGKIKSIYDLKKVLPKVKLLNNQVNTLKDITKIESCQKFLKKCQTPNLINYKDQLKNYCRTCAGLKIPLVDIFSEKGIQMRLSQQIKHLEDIREHDSLSTQMCMDCICDLKMSYKFFLQIKKAQFKLKSIYTSLNASFDQAGEFSILNKNSQSFNELISEVKKIDIYANKISNPQSFSASANSVYPDCIAQLKMQHESTQSNGYDSIEEFDPDDSRIDYRNSEIIESDLMERDECNFKNIAKVKNVYTNEKVIKVDNVSPLNVDINDKIVHQYDTRLHTYFKVESPNEIIKLNIPTDAGLKLPFLIVPKINSYIEQFKNVNSTFQENTKHPSILKRKLTMYNKLADSSLKLTHIDELATIRQQENHKLNTFKVSSSDEQGIMYVTVKGSRPNEMLLVKVKKIDKFVDKIDENDSHRKVVDMKYIVKGDGLKNLSVKGIHNVRSKEIENRGAIIEEQIEEYKKKREKILGGISSVASSKAILHSPIEAKFSDNQRLQKKIISLNKEDYDNERWMAQEDDQCDNTNIQYLHNNTNEKIQANSREYLNKLANFRQKWEQVKIKNALLQNEFDRSYLKENIGKLSCILGEKEANLKEFEEYLTQRKIVIARLKDADIISLYKDRLINSDSENINTSIFKNSCDLNDVNFINMAEVSSFDCDYCLDSFHSRDALEEHLKLHDYRIFYFCEDCGCEFATNKGKRSHSVTCLKKFICNHCHLMLESKGKKRQHEQKHCDAIYGQLCDVCGEKFKHQGTLDQHIKTQHMSWEKIFQCPKCPKKFAFKQKLTFHVKSVHTTLRAYLCEDCGADFKNPASLRHHRIRKHQPTGNKRECQVCHKLVPFYSLSKHMYTHKAYTIECPHCDKMFKNSSTLKQHLRIHEDQRQYRCDTCGVGFNRRDGLRLHMRVHQKSDSRALKECSCQICSEKFPNHSMLVIHRNRVHKDGKQYTCHICNRSMLSTRSLEWHMSHIHNQIQLGITEKQTDVIEKKRVSCNHCNKTFKTEMILRTHIKNTHMEKNPVKCLDCELMFTSEVRLRHHMMIIHNRLEGTLTCPHCPKRFVNQLRLKTHMISHSEDRPYTCEICGFNLKTKIQLIKHHQNRHSDERPLQCRYCPWRCKQVSALVCHERTHTNERPYFCIVCKQRFKYLGDKNKHERRHESLGGSGFKRIVAGRNIKNIKNNNHDIGEMTSASDQEQFELQEGEYENNSEAELTMEQHNQMEQIEVFEDKYKSDDPEIIKFHATQEGKEQDYNHSTDYEQGFEETSREASETAEVIMGIEDTTVYTEEVTAENIEHADIITEQIVSNRILQTGTVVHLQQQDDNGKIQVIPVMLSLPDLTEDSVTEVNLGSASIMYNN